MTVFLGLSHHSAKRRREKPYSKSGVLANTNLFLLGTFIWFNSDKVRHSFMCLNSNGLYRPISNDCTSLSFIHSTCSLACSITLVETLFSIAIEYEDKSESSLRHSCSKK